MLEEMTNSLIAPRVLLLWSLCTCVCRNFKVSECAHVLLVACFTPTPAISWVSLAPEYYCQLVLAARFHCLKSTSNAFSTIICPSKDWAKLEDSPSSDFAGMYISFSLVTVSAACPLFNHHCYPASALLCAEPV